jgi:hypothetical protein
MKKGVSILVLALAFLGALGCTNTNPIGPNQPVIPSPPLLMGVWTATKAEFVKVGDPNTKVDIIAQGGTFVLSLKVNNYGNNFRMTMTSPELNWDYSGKWDEILPDTLKLNFSFSDWPEDPSREQIKFSLDGDSLKLTWGPLAFGFTKDENPDDEIYMDPEEATLYLTLIRR